MWNRIVGMALALLVLSPLPSGCASDPNVKPSPVPSAEKLKAADCAPAAETYRRLLQLPPRAGMVVTSRSPQARSEEEQRRLAQDFAAQCRDELSGKVRRIIVRCWGDAPDSESFRSCSQRF